MTDKSENGKAKSRFPELRKHLEQKGLLQPDFSGDPTLDENSASTVRITTRDQEPGLVTSFEGELPQHDLTSQVRFSGMECQVGRYEATYFPTMGAKAAHWEIKNRDDQETVEERPSDIVRLRRQIQDFMKRCAETYGSGEERSYKPKLLGCWVDLRTVASLYMDITMRFSIMGKKGSQIPRVAGHAELDVFFPGEENSQQYSFSSLANFPLVDDPDVEFFTANLFFGEEVPVLNPKQPYMALVQDSSGKVYAVKDESN